MNDEIIALLAWCRDNRVKAITTPGFDATFYPPSDTVAEPSADLSELLGDHTSLSSQDRDEILYHSAGSL